jgi:hypothetical protein
MPSDDERRRPIGETKVDLDALVSRCRYVRILLTCWHCRHRADADLLPSSHPAVATSR